MERTTGAEGGVTILLVEDDESVRLVVRRSLDKAGYRVLEAGNGVEALEVLEGHEPIDLVVTDAVMPLMGGFELAARIGQDHPGIQVLLISGYTEADGGLSGNRILAEGTHFLRKPFSMQALVEKVGEMLG